MSNQVVIQIDPVNLEQKVKALSHVKDGVPKALMRTLNYVLPTMATNAAREVSSRYIVAQKEVKSKLVREKANMANLSITMLSKGRPIRLAKFKTKPNKRPGVKGAPTAFAQVMKSSGGSRIPGAFMTGFVAGAGAHSGIFVREGNSRLPIRQLHGPGVAQMLNHEEIRDAIQEKAAERFNSRIDHEIKFLLSKAGG